MILELDAETEAKIKELAQREQISATQLIKKLLNSYSIAKVSDEDFFSCAGMWQDTEINQETIRKKAWQHGSV